MVSLHFTISTVLFPCLLRQVQFPWTQKPKKKRKKKKEKSGRASSHVLLGFAEYFGIGPHYRWLEDGGAAEESMISRVRKAPHGACPEDVMRALGKDWDGHWNNHQQVMDYLYDTLDKNPDIEGIVGYSEGATMAASLIMDEERKAQETGRPRRIKCAIFFTGWPPLSPEEDMVLADESDYILDVPTLHVVGANGNFTLCYPYLNEILKYYI